jgi:glycosyltransferase involved in cell wall biosynthesis
MRIGVDAFNLAADRRGMGRLVRHNLASLRRLDAAIVLIARDDRAKPPLSAEFSFACITPRELHGAKLDAVWYPWNGMRFDPRTHAIVTVNDPFAFTYAHRDLVARWREQSPIRRAIRRADRIFTISRWSASELQRLFAVGADRLEIVTPAIDEFWHPVSAAARPPYVLFVAGPDARKNAQMFFDAYDAAFADTQTPALVVAGTLNEADEARFSRMRAPRERVKPSDEELRELYSGALAVAVPSLAEGYGLPAVEAMACGAPVLAADAAALPEACDGAALLLAPSDRNAWSAAMLRIVREPELGRALRDRGLERVKRIDPDGYAKSLISSVRRFRATAR